MEDPVIHCVTVNRRLPAGTKIVVTDTGLRVSWPSWLRRRLRELVEGRVRV